jgi:hypothetical protein
MPFPSPSRLERFLRPYENAHGLTVRVWGIEAGGDAGRASTIPSMESQIYGSPPRLLLLGAGEDGLAIVRQTHDSMEDLDGVFVPWSSVRRLERDPHLVRDLVKIEVAGLPPHIVAISNHVLLPHNRATAKSLCDLRRTRLPETTTVPVADVPTRLEAHPA